MIQEKPNILIVSPRRISAQKVVNKMKPKDKTIYPLIPDESNNNFSPNASSNAFIIHSPREKVQNYPPTSTPRFQQPVIQIITEPICKFCGKAGTPIEMKRYGSTAFCYTICLLLTTLVLFWIPFYMDSCKDIDYVCPYCGVVLATKKVTWI